MRFFQQRVQRFCDKCSEDYSVCDVIDEVCCISTTVSANSTVLHVLQPVASGKFTLFNTFTVRNPGNS